MSSLHSDSSEMTTSPSGINKDSENAATRSKLPFHISDRPNDVNYDDNTRRRSLTAYKPSPSNIPPRPPPPSV